MRGASLFFTKLRTSAKPRKEIMTAAKSEAIKKQITFTFDGDKYVIAPTQEWDLDVLEAVEDGKVVSVVRALLGAKQWEKFKATPRKVEDLNKLFEAISKAVGIQGNF